MKLSAIRESVWYETRSGIGKVIRVGGTFPPSVKVHIVAPFPRGVVMLNPRDILRKLEPGEVPRTAHEFVADTSQPHRSGRCTQCGYSLGEGNHDQPSEAPTA